MNINQDKESARKFFGKRAACTLWLAFTATATAQTNRVVTLELQCTGPQSLNEVVAILNNTGNTGTAVVLGTRLGNIYLASTLSFEARLGNGQFQNFTYDNPTFTNNTTGREDPWIVPLPAHSSYTVSINSNHFVAASGERMNEAVGISDLQLRLTGREIEPLNLDMRGLTTWEVLVTNMQSPVLAVPDDCQ